MKIQLYVGDCLKLMDGLKDQSVDLLLSDLPYLKMKLSWDVSFDLPEFWGQVSRLLKPGSAVITTAVQPFTTSLISSKIKWFKYSLVWKKSQLSCPCLAKFRPNMLHEDIVVFAVGGGRTRIYNPQFSVGTPYTKRSGNRLVNNFRFGLKPIERKNEGVRFPTSVLDFKQDWRRQDQLHPTQKPVALFRWLVDTYSDPGDLVLDPCCGSGTTGVAAVTARRSFVGIDLSREYVELTRKRIEGI